MPIFIWLELYDHFLYLLPSSSGWLPSSPPRTSAHVFLFWETGPHASEEKVVHYFIPTFSSFLASPSPALPRSASTQAGPSNQLSQQSALQIWMAMNDNRQGKLSALICHRSCKSVLGPLSFSFYISISLSICLSLLSLSLSFSCSHSWGSRVWPSSSPYFLQLQKIKSSNESCTSVSESHRGKKGLATIITLKSLPG